MSLNNGGYFEINSLEVFQTKKTFQVSGLSQYYTIVSDFRAVGLLNRLTVATHPIFTPVADRCICLGHGTVTTSFIVLGVS